MSRRAQFLEVLGIPTEWVPRERADAQAEAAPEVAVAQAAMPVAEAPVAEVAAVVAAPAAEPAMPVPAPVAPPVSRAPAAPALVPAGPEPGSAQADREAAIASMEWPALDAAVAGCTACGLCQHRTNTVFGVGDRQAEWMLVGEAPGENEDLQGEPFVGQAGKLLDNMLGALGLARGRNVFIANVLKCRPPGNRNPEPEEVAQCEPFLRRQIALVKPSVIVVLGRFAAQSLLRSTTPIGKLRGTVHSYEGIPVVVTYHPAYLLRTLTDKARAWEDLCLAREVHDRAGAGA
ncbi:uracil-DNA glycosylase [Cupriavidus necator]|uniref:Type-4 uracil-DNA glycosylase n=1 Tax=Cupriavidus necator (strain ATCC 17699 / DSM 428 / KCTC 22496 / NCIMB 10442 / H16 / Stanier 337) TaxID=381666 RepID=Q0K9V6_CUPNH|nr:uracil-DNA glycosylase [Cupriavidus necator]CAJ93215.1 Putative DNA polymerase bacteriophage-type,uracil-DNA glycosylase superfamily [Cupriavidus necator H16]